MNATHRMAAKKGQMNGVEWGCRMMLDGGGWCVGTSLKDGVEADA